MAKTKRPNWDKTTGPYEKFREDLLKADPHALFRCVNQFVLEDSSLAPQSCIDVWQCPNGKIFLVQRWEDGGFFEFFMTDTSKIEDVIKGVLAYGARKEDVPSEQDHSQCQSQG